MLGSRFAAVWATRGARRPDWYHGRLQRNINEIIDIGLPLLHNLTGHTIRLQSVQWVNQPAAARIISVYAYRYAAIGHGFIGAEGDLPIACPDEYRPAPVTAAVIDGQHGWQCQNLDTSYHIVDQPPPGPVPIPRSGICG